jgi:hypothetical protein
MRTKTLLLTAALGVAGAATTMAQVYSVNAVGYVNMDLVPGFQIIANPLDAGAGNNTASKLFGTALPVGTTIYKYTGTGYDINDYDPDIGGWANANQELAPGTGFWIMIPGTATAKVTFVGDVPQGDLKNAIPTGFSLKASQVPQAGKLATDLKFPVALGDTFYFYNTTTKGYDIFEYDPDLGGWAPSEPTPGVGGAFWVNALTAKSWDRSFSVNQ